MPETQTIMLWTNPRCCGTAFELMMEARGDYRIEVNLFDPVFYFFDGQGTDPPQPRADQEVRFDRILKDFRLRSRERPTFLRSAAYTVMHHVDEADWSGMAHTFLIRDPRYVLPSHRRFVKDITREEAGYTAQLHLFRYLSRIPGVTPLVIDAHDILGDPEGLLEAWCRAVGIPFLSHSLQWRPGFRKRWGTWGHWKREVSASTRFFGLRRNREVELKGAKDPLFQESWKCYQELFDARIVPSLAPPALRA